MSRVAIDRQMWAEPRFASLQESMHWNRATAVGTVVLFWEATRALENQPLRKSDLLLALPGPPATKPATLRALLDAGYLRVEDGCYEVVDNATWHLLKATRYKAGCRGGRPKGAKTKASASKVVEPEKPPTAAPALMLMPAPVAQPVRRGRPPKAPKEATPLQEACRVAWKAYAESYSARWQVDPIRNARTNALVKQFVQRIGAEAAPPVLAFFLAHSDAQYLSRQHDIGLAVRDAEPLHTQWLRGQAITTEDVRAGASSNRLQAQLLRLSKAP